MATKSSSDRPLAHGDWGDPWESGPWRGPTRWQWVWRIIRKDLEWLKRLLDR